MGKGEEGERGGGGEVGSENLCRKNPGWLGLTP